MIVTLASRSNATHRWDPCGIPLYHHRALLITLAAPLIFFSRPWTLRSGLSSSWFATLLFITVALYLHTSVCSIRIAHSALFSSGSFLSRFLASASLSLLKLANLSSLSLFRSIFRKTDPPLSIRLKYLSWWGVLYCCYARHTPNHVLMLPYGNLLFKIVGGVASHRIIS